MQSPTTSYQSEGPPNADSPPLVAFLKAVGQLPIQFWSVLFFPSLKTLRIAARHARWSLVGIQLLLLVALTILLNILGHHIPGATLHGLATMRVSGISVFGWLPPPLNMIVFLLATFFIGLFTAYPFSKFSGGTGTFLAHIYLLLLFTIPLVTISGLLLMIPTTGSTAFGLLALVGALLIYRLVLHGMTISMVHHLPADKATFIVLIIPMLLLIILVIIGLAHLDILEVGDAIGDIPGGSAPTRQNRRGNQQSD